MALGRYEVAAGLSNAEIAGGEFIAVSTVRKHPENAYRKLGVTNRMAAVARLRGCDGPGLARPAGARREIRLNANTEPTRQDLSRE